MNKFEHCNLCNKPLSSMLTRNVVGEYYFCPECYDNLLYPVLLMFIERTINLWGGDANIDARRQAIEAFRPTADSGRAVAFSGLSFASDGTKSGRFVQDENVAAKPRNEGEIQDVDSISAGADKLAEG